MQLRSCLSVSPPLLFAPQLNPSYCRTVQWIMDHVADVAALNLPLIIKEFGAAVSPQQRAAAAAAAPAAAAARACPRTMAGWDRLAAVCDAALRLPLLLPQLLLAAVTAAPRHPADPTRASPSPCSPSPSLPPLPSRPVRPSTGPSSPPRCCRQAALLLPRPPPPPPLLLRCCPQHVAPWVTLQASCSHPTRHEALRASLNRTA